MEKTGDYDVETMLMRLKKDCKPFLKDMSRSRAGDFMYRGIRKNLRNMTKRQVREDRTPKDMGEDLHKYLDNYFFKKFKVHARSNAAFCTGSKDLADDFGTPYIVFPIGKYEVIWSPSVKDLFTTFEDASISDLEPNSYDVERARDSWEMEFGEEGDRIGEWAWKKWKLDGRRVDRNVAAYEFAKLQVDRVGWDEWKDYDTARENWEGIAYDDMYWIPAMTWEDYYDDFLANDESEKINAIDTIINDYKKGDPVAAIQTGNEIMLWCKEYYVIQPIYESDLQRHWKFLINPRLNPSQLDLPFGKKK